MKFKIVNKMEEDSKPQINEQSEVMQVLASEVEVQAEAPQSILVSPEIEVQAEVPQPILAEEILNPHDNSNLPIVSNISEVVNENQPKIGNSNEKFIIDEEVDVDQNNVTLKDSKIETVGANLGDIERSNNTMKSFQKDIDKSLTNEVKKLIENRQKKVNEESKYTDSLKHEVQKGIANAIQSRSFPNLKDDINQQNNNQKPQNSILKRVVTEKNFNPRAVNNVSFETILNAHSKQNKNDVSISFDKAQYEQEKREKQVKIIQAMQKANNASIKIEYFDRWKRVWIEYVKQKQAQIKQQQGKEIYLIMI